jgi:hypothetical protein
MKITENNVGNAKKKFLCSLMEIVGKNMGGFFLKEKLICSVILATIFASNVLNLISFQNQIPMQKINLL